MSLTIWVCDLMISDKFDSHWTDLMTEWLTLLNKQVLFDKCCDANYGRLTASPDFLTYACWHTRHKNTHNKLPQDLYLRLNWNSTPFCSLHMTHLPRFRSVYLGITSPGLFQIESRFANWFSFFNLEKYF